MVMRINWKYATILLAAILLLAPFSGCIGNTDSEKDVEKQIPEEKSGAKPHIVVAIIDTGINPYHEVFRRPDWTQHPSTYIPGFLSEIPALNLTFGDDYAKNIEQDTQVWENTEVEHIYWVPETNIITISFGDFSAVNTVSSASGGKIILDDSGHGTYAAHCVSSMCPNATVLMIESPDPLKAISWVIDQKWIDVFFSVATAGDFDEMVWANATEILYEKGVVVLGPAGNYPLPSIIGLPITTGANLPMGMCPPWEMIVGGAQNETKGETAIAGKTPDFVSDYVQIMAQHDSVNGYEIAGGTSFSTPKAAGVAAEIIYRIREKTGYSGGISNGSLISGVSGFGGLLVDGNINNQEFRNLMNQSAIYWQTAEYNPTNSSSMFNSSWIPLYLNEIADFATATAATPVNPIIPAAQMGWGYVGPEIVGTAVKIALGEMEAPDKGLNAEYMKQEYALRVAYWENYPK
jgi:hypothetical protein